MTKTKWEQAFFKILFSNQTCNLAKRTPDYLSVFTTELIAIVLALHWLLETQIKKAVLCSESLAALRRIQSGQSNCRQHYRNNATAI